MGGKKSWCFLQLLLAVRPIKMLFPASLGSGSVPAVLCCSWRLWGHAFISVKCKAEAVEQDGRRDFSQRSVGAQPKGGCHLITAFVCRLWVSCCHCNPIYHRKLAAAGCFLSCSVLSCFCSSCMLLRKNLYSSISPYIALYPLLSPTRVTVRSS